MPSSSSMSSMSSMLLSSLLPSSSYPFASAYPFASTSSTRNDSFSCNRKVEQGRRRKRMATMNRSSSLSSSSSSSSLLVLLISLFVVCCNNNSNNNNNMLLFAYAFSSSSTSTTTTPTTPATTTTKNRIEYFNPDINTIENDQLLIAIQECRRTSFPIEKKNFMDAERDFIAAKNVLSKKKICVIIFDNDTNENNEFPRIVGTADLQPQYNYLNKQKQFIPKGIISNVFVRPDERGKKFGQQLMIEGIENILVPELYTQKLTDPTAIAEAQSKGITLTLEVYTQNTPALQLYFKLGYTPDGLINEGVYKLSQLLNSNLFITLTKTIPL